MRNLNLGIGLLIAATIALPVASTWVILQDPTTLPGVSSAPSVLWGPPTQLIGAETLPGVLTLASQIGPSLYAPNWSGIVTSLSAPGKTIYDGSNVLAVNGVERRLCVSPTPLFRVLRLGDQGSDVVEARRCVAILGGGNVTPVGSPTRVDEILVEAFNRVSAGLGVPPNGTFDPSWVIWSTDAGWSISSFDIDVGQSAPPPGSIFATTSSQISSAEAAVTDGGADFARRVAKMGSRITFTVDGFTLNVSDNGDINSKKFAAELLQIEIAAPSVDPGTGGNATPSQPSSIQMNGSVEIRGGTRLMVPASAVFTDAQGRSCVVVEGLQSRTTEVRVAVRPSSIGTVVVEGKISRDSVLALDVRELGRINQCP